MENHITNVGKFVFSSSVREGISINRLYATKLISIPNLFACNEAGPRILKFVLAVQEPLLRNLPRVIFLDNTNATTASLFEHTPTTAPCRLYVSSPSQHFQRSNISCRLYSASASLSILIAFVPNPTYTFPAPSTT